MFSFSGLCKSFTFNIEVVFIILQSMISLRKKGQQINCTSRLLMQNIYSLLLAIVLLRLVSMTLAAMFLLGL
jgi:hypothetical protein